MRIINKPRCSGKTTQLIYLSEFHNWPIICCNKNHKDNIQYNALNMGCKIPDPITVAQLLNRKSCGENYDGYLVDEADAVLESLLTNLVGRPNTVKGATITSPVEGRSLKR